MVLSIADVFSEMARASSMMRDSAMLACFGIDQEESLNLSKEKTMRC